MTISVRSAEGRALCRAGLIALALALVGVNPASAAQNASQGQASAAPAPCVAILLPNVQGVDGNAVNVATGIQQLFDQYLTGPSIRAVVLEARLPSLASEEARQKHCDQMLQATVTKKHKSGMFGKVLSTAGSAAAWTMPYGGTAGSAVARGAAIAGAEAAGSIAANTKAKDEMQIEYQLTTPDGKVGFGPKTDKAKASSDGEDLLTPLVRGAAEAIVGQVMKK